MKNDSSLLRRGLARISRSAGAATVVGALMLSAAGAQNANNAATGNAARGSTLFTTGFKCYACHGFDAQTGQRRLKPMNYTEDGFITFVRSSPLPQMPAYPDASRAALADVYAYVLSIPVDAPDIDEIPLLRDIRDSKMRALGEQ